MIPAPHGAGSCPPTLARGTQPAAVRQDPYVTLRHPRVPPPPEEAHSVLKKPVYTAALGGGVCRTGKKEGAGAGAQQGWGPPVGHQPGHAGLQGTGQGVRGCPSPSGQQVAPEGTGSGRRPGSGLLSPGLELGPLVAL